MAGLKNIAEYSDRRVGRTTLGRVIMTLAVFLVICSVFAYLAREVFEGETLHRDTQLLMMINRRFSSPSMDKLMLAVTTAGGPAGVIAAAVIAAAYMYWKKFWYAMAFLLFSIGGAAVLESSMKYIFERQRPHLWNLLVHETSFSFPSGHATMSMAIVAALTILLWRTKWRWYCVVIGVFFVLIVGFSRLYLGVHYPTDIVAGWIVALAWVTAMSIILGIVRTPRLIGRLLTPDHQ